MVGRLHGDPYELNPTQLKKFGRQGFSVEYRGYNNIYIY